MESNLEALLNAEQDDLNKKYEPYVKALRRWKVWRDTVPLFYSTCVHAIVDSPSPSVQLYPLLQPDSQLPALRRHAVLYGTQNSMDDGTSALVFGAVAVNEPGSRVGLSREAIGGFMAMWEVCAFSVPASKAPDRLRYCPGRPLLVAVKAASVGIGLYDISPALEQMQDWQQEMRQLMAGREAGGLAASAGGRRSSEGDDCDPEELPHRARPRNGCGEAAAADRLEWGPQAWLPCERQDGVAMTWGHGGSGGGGGDLRLFSGVRNGGIAEYAVREDGSLAEVSVRQGGHDGDAEVMELAWFEVPAARDPAAPGSSTDDGTCRGLLASGGTDGRTLLWDPRQGPPALQAPRCRRDINSVALTSTAGGANTLLAAAGEDGIVRVYDIRHLSAVGGGGGSLEGAADGGGTGASPRALHRLKGHKCVVLQLAFSPHAPSLLASSDQQGRVLLWELGRSEPLEEGLSTRPELLFAHAGHLLPVEDISWSTEVYGTLASVSGYLDPEVVETINADFSDGEVLQGQPPAVEVWRPAMDLLPASPGRRGPG